MAGHSKWAQIKRQKGANDAKRSQLFGKIARLIAVEAKKVKGDTQSPSLKAVIERAKKQNMPNDIIDRAVKKGSTEKGADLLPITYESYGPGGVGIIIEVLTDSRNRSAAEVKHILSKHNATLAGIGAVTWAFSKENNQWAPTTTVEIDDAIAPLLEALVEELENNQDVQEVITNARE